MGYLIGSESDAVFFFPNLLIWEMPIDQLLVNLHFDRQCIRFLVGSSMLQSYGLLMYCGTITGFCCIKYSFKNLIHSFSHTWYT